MWSVWQTSAKCLKRKHFAAAIFPAAIAVGSNFVRWWPIRCDRIEVATFDVATQKSAFAVLEEAGCKD